MVISSILLVVAGLSLALLPFGRHLGYEGASGYLMFGAAAAAILISAQSMAARVFGWRGLPDALIRIAVIGLAEIGRAHV